MRPDRISASVSAGAACILAAVCAAGAGGGATSASAAPAHGGAAAAVWKEHRVEFLYTGRTSRYSCDGLRDKVRAMLLDLGVRRDLSVVPFGCGDYRVTADAAGFRLRIVFFSPALADESRMSANGASAATRARFERFTLTSDAFRNIGVGDCELVQEFARQLLPKLAVRDVQEDIVCVPYQPSSSRFFVRGEVLRTAIEDGRNS